MEQAPLTSGIHKTTGPSTGPSTDPTGRYHVIRRCHMAMHVVGWPSVGQICQRDTVPGLGGIIGRVSSTRASSKCVLAYPRVCTLVRNSMAYVCKPLKTFICPWSSKAWRKSHVAQRGWRLSLCSRMSKGLVALTPNRWRSSNRVPRECHPANQSFLDRQPI